MEDRNTLRAVAVDIAKMQIPNGTTGQGARRLILAMLDTKLVSTEPGDGSALRHRCEVGWVRRALPCPVCLYDTEART